MNFNSIHGKIVSNWSREGDVLTMEVVVPPNTCARVYVPAKDLDNVTESGKTISKARGIRFKQMENDMAVFYVESGMYTFVVAP